MWEGEGERKGEKEGVTCSTMGSLQVMGLGSLVPYHQ